MRKNQRNRDRAMAARPGRGRGRRRGRLQKRLAAYASMAAAGGVTAGTASPAAADTLLQDIPDVTLFDATLAIDIDGDGVNELTLAHEVHSASTNVALRVFPGSNPTASVIIDSAGAGPYQLPTAAVLESQSLITPARNFYDVVGASSYPDLAQYWTSNPSGGGGPIAYGAWAGGASEKFLGVRFEISGVAHLGFVQLSVEDLQGSPGPFAATVAGYGYNDDPIGTSAGNALMTTAIPEPSTLGALALGAVGVQWIRRRRPSRA